MSDYRIVTGRRKQLEERIAELEKKIEYLCLDQENYEPILVAENQRLKDRIAELDTENKRLKNRGTITSPMDGLFEENERLKAKLDAAKNVKTFGMEASGSSDGTYRVVQWAKWDDVLEALGEAK